MKHDGNLRPFLAIDAFHAAVRWPPSAHRFFLSTPTISVVALVRHVPFICETKTKWQIDRFGFSTNQRPQSSRPSFDCCASPFRVAPTNERAEKERHCRCLRNRNRRPWHKKKNDDNEESETLGRGQPSLDEGPGERDESNMATLAWHSTISRKVEPLTFFRCQIVSMKRPCSAGVHRRAIVSLPPWIRCCFFFCCCSLIFFCDLRSWPFTVSGLFTRRALPGDGRPD